MPRAELISAACWAMFATSGVAILHGCSDGRRSIQGNSNCMLNAIKITLTSNIGNVLFDGPIHVDTNDPSFEQWRVWLEEIVSREPVINELGMAPLYSARVESADGAVQEVHVFNGYAALNGKFFVLSRSTSSKMISMLKSMKPRGN